MEKLDKFQLHELVWHFEAVWKSERKEVLPLGKPAEQMCRILRKYILEANEIEEDKLQNAGFYYRYNMHQDSAIIFKKAMANVGNSTNEELPRLERIDFLWESKIKFIWEIILAAWISLLHIQNALHIAKTTFESARQG